MEKVLDRISESAHTRITGKQAGGDKTMMIFLYASKKALAENIGKPLDYEETSMFGEEFRRDGMLTGSNRPSITGIKGREFFANVTMKNGLIHSVK